RFSRDWSSDVCSSDLDGTVAPIVDGNWIAAPSMSEVTRLYQSKVKSKRPFKNIASKPKSSVVIVSQVISSLNNPGALAYRGISRSEERRVGKGCRHVR